MYFGSVRFFRHVIVGAVLFVIMVSISLNIILAVNLSSSKNESAGLAKDLARLSAEASVADPVPPLSLDSLSNGLSSIAKDADPALAYQSLYEDMYCEKPIMGKNPENTVYLTFDDGPSKYTQKVIDTLAVHDVKATFFVVGSKIPGNEATLQAIADAGHTIGIHTYSHKYNEIYENVEAYLADFYKAYTLVYETTGVRPTVFRFPGGSINAYNQPVYQQIISEMLRRGFVYYDWNVSAGDASNKATVATVKSSILDYVDRFSSSIVLMHDSRNVTVTALDSIISELVTREYHFDKITPSVTPVVFGYSD